MRFETRKATRSGALLRMAITGPTGSGKTYSALAVATGLGKKIAVIDTEHRTSEKYSDEFEFDVLDGMDDYSPATYTEALEYLRSQGYEVVIIDSLSHAWMGKGGALEMVDNAARRNRGNAFAGWRDVTPAHNRMVDAILAFPGHVIATLRAKTEYIVEKDNRGRSVPKKIGMAPIQKDGIEYEFDISVEMDFDHHMVVSKSRWSKIADAVIPRPGAEFGERLAQWLAGTPETVTRRNGAPVSALTNGQAPATVPPSAPASAPEQSPQHQSPPPEPATTDSRREWLDEITGCNTRAELAELYRRMKAELPRTDSTLVDALRDRQAEIGAYQEKAA